MRGATTTFLRSSITSRFNSRPSCEGRPVRRLLQVEVMVSIHAPHARGDSAHGFSSPAYARFNSRPSCEGRHIIEMAAKTLKFQFTPLMRGATRRNTAQTVAGLRFNSRPSCEGRLFSQHLVFSPNVSIHAPHARGDKTCKFFGHIAGFNSRPSGVGRQTRLRGGWSSMFQFTPLMRGATELKYLMASFGVSIHAPHARGDRDKS